MEVEFQPNANECMVVKQTRPQVSVHSCKVEIIADQLGNAAQDHGRTNASDVENYPPPPPPHQQIIYWVVQATRAWFAVKTGYRSRAFTGLASGLFSYLILLDPGVTSILI